MPVHERAERILLPGPHVQRGQPITVGRVVQMKELPHQVRRLGMRGVPLVLEHEVFGAGEFPMTDVRQIARHLHITTLLDGSVRKTDERLLWITVDLVDVASGYQHWSERFDRTVADVFAMQDEIAEHVAIRVKRGLLSRDERQRLIRPQTTAAAYEFYLRGRH